MMPSDEADESMTPLGKRVEQLRDVHGSQGSHGNWNSDRYMRGMFNGMELALAIMEDRAPSYKEAPAEYLNEPNPQDFSASLRAMLNYSGWDSAVGMPDFLLSDLLVHILQGMEVAHDRQSAGQLSPVQDTVTVTDGFGNPVAEYPTSIEEKQSLMEGTWRLHEWKNDNAPSDRE